MSDDECGGYGSCGDEGDYGSYDGDDGHCYDDSGNYGSYEDEAGHYDDREDDEDYEARDDECDDPFASSQEYEDGDASRYEDPTYSSCEEFDIDDSDIDRVDDDVEHMGYSYASFLSVANGVQGSSSGPSISMGGGGGCSMGKKKLASSRYAKRPNASNSHVEDGLRNGVAFATKGLYAVRGVDGCSRSSTMGYGTKARGTYGFHGEIPSLTSNNIANVGRVTGSGDCSSGVATSGGIRKTQVVGVDTCRHSSSHLDANLQNLGRCRFVVGVNGIDGYLLKIGDTDANCISTSLVDRLRIPCHKLAHPYEYDGVWVSKEARVLISHGSYRCYVWCDVYPMRHVDVWMGEPWLEGKRVQYSMVKGAYLVGVGQRVYDFVPYRAKSRVPTSAPSLAMQRSKEQELHSMGNNVQTRSPTNTSNGGTSSRKELANVNKVSPKPLPKPSGSPTKKVETSSDESPSPRFRVDVKSPPTPAMGILGPRPNSPEFERQKIERSKGATGDNSRVEKGEVVLSDVSGLSPPESTPDLGKKMREKKEGKRKIESEGTPYSNLNPLSFSSMCLNSCVGILGGKPMEPQPCSEMERQGEGDAECELQGGDIHDASKEPEDVEPTRLVGYFFLGWFVLAAVLSIAFNR